MANVTVTPVAPGRGAGANFTDGKTAATAGNNYLISNDGNTRLLCQSTSGATITVATPGTVDGNAVADLSLTVTANKLMAFGPFPQSAYGTTMTVTVSANTDLLALRG